MKKRATITGVTILTILFLAAIPLKADGAVWIVKSTYTKLGTAKSLFEKQSPKTQKLIMQRVEEKKREDGGGRYFAESKIVRFKKEATKEILAELKAKRGGK